MVRKGVAKLPTERELAEKLGIDRSLVGRKRRQGKSDEQIAAESVLQRQKAAEQEDANLRSLEDADLRSLEQPGSSQSFADAQARKERALATLREMEIAEKQGVLINADEVKTVWSAHISACKSKLLSMADELADRLTADSITGRIAWIRRSGDECIEAGITLRLGIGGLYLRRESP